MINSSSKIENEEINKETKIVKEGNLIFALNEEDKTAFLINNDSAADNILIPRSVKYGTQEFIITSIKENSFRYSLLIKSIQFPSDSELFTIGKEAFYCCFLESISIPASTRKICERAFNDCLRLKNAEFPTDSKLEIIGEDAFKSTRIEKIKIPSTVTRICKGAFSCSRDLLCIEIPTDSKLQAIEERAFDNTLIKEILIPSSVSELKEGWCQNTDTLTKVTIMPGNKNYKNFDEKIVIGKSDTEKDIKSDIKSYNESDLKSDNFDVLVFASRDIQKVMIPSFITRIASYSFSGSSIECITISPHVSEISEGAFNNCEKLERVDFVPDSNLQIIGKKAFMSTSIEKFVIPPHVVKICEKAFYECCKLFCVECSINCNLQVIESEAFRDSTIESLSIPSSVLDLQKGWCEGTSKLDEVKIIMNNNKQSNIALYNGSIIGKSDIKSDIFDVLLFVPRKTKFFSIPSFIKKIGSCAFSTSLIECICIPPHVTHICDSAFKNCDALTNVEIHLDSELQEICEFSFSNSFIKSFFVPSHVKRIGKKAFSSCKNCDCIEIAENSELLTIEKEAFSFSSIKRLSVPSSVSEIQKGWIIGTSNLNKIKIMPNKTFNISYYKNEFIIGKSDSKSDIFDVLLFVPRKIKFFSIPSFIKKIGSYAFSCSSINHIFIPPHVTHICDGAFHLCENLNCIEIPSDSNLKVIGKYSFFSTKIKSFYIPSGVEHIHKYSFFPLNDIQIIEIDENSRLNEIDKICFYTCQLANIMIPNRLKGHIK